MEPANFGQSHNHMGTTARGPNMPEDQPPSGSTGLQPKEMIPARGRRRTKVERVSMRILATGGIIGLAVALGAILGTQDVDGWIIGLVVGLTSVILAGVLWSSRQL